MTIWPTVSLRDVTERTRTWNPIAEPRNGIQYVDVSAVSRDELKITTPAYLTRDIPSRARKVVQTGDTIFATVRPTLRRVAKVPAELDGEIASTAFCVLRPNHKRIDPDYLFFAANSDIVLNEIEGLQSGASYPAVRDSDVLDCKIPLPPLGDQSAIASALMVCRTALLDQFHTLIVLDDLKRATMRELFTRGLRGEAQKDSEIGPLPESWEARPLKAICNFQSGGTPRKSVASHWQGAIPWVSGKDLKKPVLHNVPDRISEDGLAASSKLAPADAVLILVRGMGLAKDLPISRLAVPMAFNQDIKALTSKCHISGSYLRSAIYNRKEVLLGRIVPSAHGTMTLNLDDLETFIIPCPTDPSEVQEITEVIDAIDAKIDLHKRKKTVLEELFRALLHKLMTGEIRVADLDLSALADIPHPNPSPEEEGLSA
jgi:type I restriction enzyme, S subunit